MHRSHGSPLPLAFIVAAICACGDAPETVTRVQVPGTISAKAAVAIDEIVVYGDLGLAAPESVAHDPVNDLYVVSNLGDPFSAAQDGFIARIHPDGTMETPDWITGLISPSGIAIEGRELYVVDRGGVHVFDLDTAEHLDYTAFPEGISFLNDICGGPDGRFYVTDSGIVPNEEGTGFVPTGTDAIYEIRDGDVDLFASGTRLGNPNGCLRQGARNLFVTRYSAEGGIYRISASGTVHEVAGMPPGAGLNDSALRLGGAWLVTSWGVDPFAPDGDGVHLVGEDGSVTTVVPDFIAPGDMGYDASRRRALIPSVLGNVIAVVPAR